MEEDSGGVASLPSGIKQENDDIEKRSSRSQGAEARSQAAHALLGAVRTPSGGHLITKLGGQLDGHSPLDMAYPSFAPIESLNYSLLQTEDDRSAQMRPGLSWDLGARRWRWHWPRRKILLGWFLVALNAVLLALVYFTMSLVADQLIGMRWRLTFAVAEAVDGSDAWRKKVGAYAAAFPIFLCLNLALVLVSTSLVVYFAPAARGAGLVEVRSYLNGLKMPGAFSWQATIAKTVGSVFAQSGSIATGKEGPMVQIGCQIASAFANSRGPQILKVFRNDFERRDLLTTGAAMGVAVAFNAPIGGILYALEEAATWWRREMMWKSFFGCALAVIVLGIMNGICIGENRCGYYSPNKEFSEWKASVGSLPTTGSLGRILIDRTPIIVIGLCGGIVSVVFISLNMWLARVRERFINVRKSLMILDVLLITVVSSVVTFYLPFFGVCLPLKENQELPISSFQRYNCGANEYNDMAMLTTGSMTSAIRYLFTTPDEDPTALNLSFLTVFVFFVTLYSLTVVIAGAAIPSGLFTPTILVGASMGRAIGVILKMGQIPDLDLGLCALLGSASLVAGLMRRTVSLCVVLAEVTNSSAVVPSMMLVSLIAKSIADRFTDSIVVENIRFRRIPFLFDQPTGITRGLGIKTRDICSRNVVGLCMVETAGKIIDTLDSSEHAAFPVMDGTGQHYIGIILRKNLFRCLEEAYYRENPLKTENSALGRRGTRSVLLSATKMRNTKGRPLFRVDLISSEQRNSIYVSLEKYCQPCPVVNEDAPLEMTHEIFRTMALRNLPVVEHHDKIVGMIVRKDLLGVEAQAIAKLAQIDSSYCEEVDEDSSLREPLIKS